MARSKHPFGELPVGVGDAENDLLMELVFPPQQPYLLPGSGRGGWMGQGTHRRAPGHTLQAHNICKMSPPRVPLKIRGSGKLYV